MIKDIFAAGGFLSGESNVIPILSVDDEIKLSEESLPDEVPLLPLRNTVLFPGMVIPITIGREKSLKLARDCSNIDCPIGVVAQRDNNVEDPTIKDMYRVGTIARILKTLNIPDGNIMMVVQGVKVFEIGRVLQSRPYYRCEVHPYPTNDLDEETTDTEEFKAKMIMIRETMGNILQLTMQSLLSTISKAIPSCSISSSPISPLRWKKNRRFLKLRILCCAPTKF